MSFDLTTADGPKTVRHWGYRLQGGRSKRKSRPLGVKEFISVPHDLLVMDFSRDGSNAGAFSESEIAQIKARPGVNSVIVSYISIGEASDYRDHWQAGWTTFDNADQRAAGMPTTEAPAWLGAWNESWPNSRKVRFWQKEWQDIIFNSERTGWLDRIVAAGFDGAYLDIVDAYYHWGAEVPAEERHKGDPENEREAASRMIDFIDALSAHAREINPEFLIIPQNAINIIDALEDEDHKRRDKYLAAINAIACEDLFFRNGDSDENRGFGPDEEAIDVLVRDFHDSNVPVMCVDYLSQKKKIEQLYEQAPQRGFLPYAAPSRELNMMGPPFEGPPTAIA